MTYAISLFTRAYQRSDCIGKGSCAKSVIIMQAYTQGVSSEGGSKPANLD